MTKEKLEKEAEEIAKKFFGKPTDLVDLDNLRIFKNGYLAGAEPREKQIQIDAEQIRALQKQNGELTDRVKEDINKMTDQERIEQLEKEVKILTKRVDFFYNEIRPALQKDKCKYRHAVVVKYGMAKSCFDVYNCQDCDYKKRSDETAELQKKEEA